MSGSRSRGQGVLKYELLLLLVSLIWGADEQQMLILVDHARISSSNSGHILTQSC